LLGCLIFDDKKRREKGECFRKYSREIFVFLFDNQYVMMFFLALVQIV